MGIMRPTLFTGDFDMKGKRLFVNIFSIITMVLIITLSIVFFVPISYLVRPKSVERDNVIGLYAERDNSLDMIYIGGSACYVFWEPLRAYDTYGFTSYNFAVNTITAVSLKYFIKEAQKTQNPKLYIVDLRPFQYCSENGFEEVPVRNTVDGFMYSKNRNDLIDVSVPNSVERVSYYFDFFKYKNRLILSTYSALRNPREAAPYIKNVKKNDLKGFDFVPYRDIVSLTDYSDITEKQELNPTSKAYLIDLLDYCKDQTLNVMFIVHSYVQTEEHKKLYNYMQGVIEEYGFDFLNTNDYYSTLNFDESLDFYNNNHVTVFGAEKYTDFVAQYIKERYDLPDHRDDVNYSEWSDLYPAFLKQTEETKEAILRINV